MQPIIIRELFANTEAVERGLLTRTLCFVSDTPPREDDGTVAALNPGIVARWEALVNAILASRKQQGDTPRVIQCSAEGRELFREFHNESVRLRLGSYSDVQGELTRWRENACRVGLALSIGDDLDGVELSGPQAERAVLLTRWAQRSTLALLSAGRQTERMKLAERLRDLLAANGGEMSLSRLEKHHSLRENEVSALCRWFPQWFQQERKETGGRPAQVVRYVGVLERTGN